ncbi:hypothetical protein BWQ96_04284 [Gracilariopsis chorda]|uniref:Uncharacterized protein n=1 Tax=Gracilariopsis chorda TaxID=448386 RepID=A0A2V3IV25_9FLOR|nr:hypothetical protein BWQ96_04284 [Gracilariopsis chorda]|eukprot:PXF45971.1 hypothetical protein BWQ96_04284 [Gracilariopsis chorda]
MSNDLYYPNLRDLEQRRDELVNDITSLHRRLVLRSESLEEADSKLVPTLTDILHKNGINSARELADEALSKLDNIKRNTFETFLNALQDAYLNFNPQISYFLVLPFVSNIASNNNHFSLLLDSAALYVASRLSVQAVALSLSGNILALRDAVKTAQVANTIYDNYKDQGLNPAIELGLRVNRDAPDFSNVPVPQIVSALDGAAQVKVLRSEINDFFRKRLSLELVDNFCAVSVSVTGKIESALTIVSNMRGIEAIDSSLQKAVDILVSSFIGEIGSVWDAGDLDAAASAWAATDLERKSYTDDDPSIDDIIKKLSQ